MLVMVALDSMDRNQLVNVSNEVHVQYISSCKLLTGAMHAQ